MDRVKWTKKDKDEFRGVKEALTAAPLLSPPDVKRPFQLFMDVSNHTTHGVLTGLGQETSRLLVEAFGPGQQRLAHVLASNFWCSIVGEGS